MTTPDPGGDDPVPPFAELLALYADDPDDLPVAQTIAFADALAAGDDPLHLLPYLASLGIDVRQPDDLLAINADDTEDEVHCWRVQEGIAVSVVSDGAWLLFTT